MNSGYIDALLATNFVGRIFRFLGSRPVRLSWDAETKIVTITATDGTGEVIVSKSVDHVDRAYFIRGSYFIRIDGQLYDLQIQHSFGQSGLMNDVADMASVDLTSVVADSKSGIEDLATLIENSSTEKKMTRSVMSSKTYMKFLIITVPLGVAIALLIEYMKIGDIF